MANPADATAAAAEERRRQDEERRRPEADARAADERRRAQLPPASNPDTADGMPPLLSLDPNKMNTFRTQT